MKAQKFKKGQQIVWKWTGRPIEGVVEEVFFEPVTKLIKGKAIKRNATAENPVYLVRSVAGNQALKLQSELTPSTKGDRKQPRMFGD